MSSTDSPRTMVLGAGPVGLATALLLAKQGHRVEVYEAREELDLHPDNSYPIGVNPRGQEAFRRIDPSLLDALREEGEVVAAFDIYAGARRVAHLDSGTLVATTRAFLTRVLLERAQADDRITYLPGHALAGLDLAARTLTFRCPSGEEALIEAADARVIAADGVWSATRRALAEQVPGFEPRVGDWGVRFRVAFSQPGASAPDLDPSVHHIFGSKGIYTATLKDGRWCVVLTAIDADEAGDLLLSEEASEANIEAVRRHVEKHAPLAAPLLTHDDYAAYFTRKPFGGAVVICPRIAFDEWLLLVGDAAHSVLPPTGEGVNSGLEDAFLLADAAATGSPTWFADFERDRLPDLHALGEYAWVLRDNVRSTDPARSAATVMLRIVDAAAGALHLPNAQVEARLFGPEAGLTPYREAIGPWLTQRATLFPAAQAVARGVASVVRAVRPSRSEPGTPAEQVAGLALDPATGNGRRLVVVGGSQGTGRLVAEAALRAGWDVTVVSRSGVELDGATVVAGDAAIAAVAREAVDGADAVVVTVGGNDSPFARTRVTRAVINAMQESGVRRLVVQTSLGVGDSARRLPAPLRALLLRLLAKPLEDHAAQEAAVRGSGLDWTIVRPGGLSNAPATGRWQALRSGEKGQLRRQITRGDVAGCLLATLDDDTTIGESIDVSGA